MTNENAAALGRSLAAALDALGEDAALELGHTGALWFASVVDRAVGHEVDSARGESLVGVLGDIASHWAPVRVANDGGDDVGA